MLDVRVAACLHLISRRAGVRGRTVPFHECICSLVQNKPTNPSYTSPSSKMRCCKWAITALFGCTPFSCRSAARTFLCLEGSELCLHTECPGDDVPGVLQQPCHREVNCSLKVLSSWRVDESLALQALLKSSRADQGL